MKAFLGYEKGVNLGGWLSQCQHTDEHYQSFICEEDFVRLSTWGIDHVRIPVDYDLFENKNGMDYLRQAVDWCGKYKLNMVLDLHKTEGYSFDDGENEDGFFMSAQLQEQFYCLWEQLATEFGKYHDRIAFELLNEVTDRELCAKWNRIAKNCVERIRKIAPEVYILIGGYWNNSVEALEDLDEPYDDRIVYNFHCYEPLLFTHQGASWVQGMPSDFRMKFPETAEVYAAALKQLNILAMDIVNRFGTDMIDGEIFEQMFASAAEIAEKRNVSLYCGEYGVIDLADDESTVAWYQAINRAFKKYGIGHAAWSYKEMNFGLVNMKEDTAEKVKMYL